MGLMDAEHRNYPGNTHCGRNVRKRDTDFIICIADNGVGIPEPTLSFLNQPGEFMEKLNERGKHIGLSNIRQRLDYIYHGRARMIIENRGRHHGDHDTASELNNFAEHTINQRWCRGQGKV